VLAYFASGFSDLACNELFDTRFYGPMFDLVGAALSSHLAPLDFSRRHLLSGLLGVAAVLGVALYLGRTAHPIAAVTATLGLALNPIFFGHAFFNPKDIPFAAAFVASMLCLDRWLVQRNWRWLIALGFALGAALGVRVGGVLLLAGVIGPSLLAERWLAFRDARQVPPSRSWITLGGGLLMAFAMAWILMVLPWPWAHQSPILHPIEAIGVAFRFPRDFPVLFGGEYLMSSALPRSYLMISLLITTPLTVLALAALGGLSAVRGLGRAPSQEALRRFIALAWVGVPVALFTIARPNVYDGTRHFLFVLPGLAVLAGIGAGRLLHHLQRPVAKAIAGVAIVIGLLLPVPDMVRIHPYQYAWYNELVGGPSGAGGRYESDYWLLSYREAAEWLNEESAQRLAEGQPVRIIAAGNDLSSACLKAFLDPRIEASFTMKIDLSGALPEGIDYYVATTRYGLHTNYPEAPAVYRVGRFGVVYSLVRGR